jgi:hypothetical protein
VDYEELNKIRYEDDFKWSANPRVYKRIKWWHIANQMGLCTICPPHRGENAWNQGARRAKPDKYKSKRKGRC